MSHLSFCFQPFLLPQVPLLLAHAHKITYNCQWDKTVTEIDISSFNLIQKIRVMYMTDIYVYVCIITHISSK